jgi:hypothetical protein
MAAFPRLQPLQDGCPAHVKDVVIQHGGLIPLYLYPSPATGIQPMAAHVKDAVIQDGGLSKHPPCQLTPPHVSIPAPRSLRWLPFKDDYLCTMAAHVKDAGFQDGGLSRHSPHLLTPPHVPIPTPRYPSWHACPRWLAMKEAVIQNGGLYKHLLYPSPCLCPRPAYPRWLPVHGGYT